MAMTQEEKINTIVEVLEKHNKVHENMEKQLKLIADFLNTTAEQVVKIKKELLDAAKSNA
jgi:uncharacterized coiled-coil protein SlyX